MLTILYPEVCEYLKDFSHGLMPLFNSKENRHFLVIKTLKEYILTARKNSGFKIYFMSDRTSSVSHLGLITAFFDDVDEPLILITGLFSQDPMAAEFTKLFSQERFDVYFFDDHNREFLGAKALNKEYKRFSAILNTATYQEPSPSQLELTFDILKRNFGTRNSDDDAEAYNIELGERLYPDDIMLMDNTGQLNRVNGLEEIVPTTELVRKNKPGPMQEKDIILLMVRVFEANQIFLNPIRVDTKRELTDILIITDDTALFIQAKDSPNTEEMIERKIERKKSTVRAHIEKAVNQLRGTLTYALENNELIVSTNERISKISLKNRKLIGLVVVKELFDYQESSTSLLKLVREIQTPALIIDYLQLHELTFRIRNPQEFINGCYRIVQFALDKNEYPKLAWNKPPKK